MPASVLTQHNDSGRTGHNPSETVLAASSVSGDTFGRLFDLPVDGPVSAQPLVVAGVKVGSRRRNLLIVATMHNAVYAFDADAAAPEPVWEARLGGIPSVPTSAFGRDYNDMQHRNVGVLGTPVVDAAKATLYLVAMTWDAARFNRAPQDAFRHLLFALDLATGEPLRLSGGAPNPRPFASSVQGSGYLAPNRIAPARRDGDAIVFDNAIPSDRIAASAGASVDEDVKDTRLWPIRDGAFLRGEPMVVFSSMMHLQRPGLLLSGGLVFSAFGSHGDADPYHGWVFAHDAATLEPRGVLCTTPNGAQGGVWQAGEGLVADAEGFVYVGTGNGDTDVAEKTDPAARNYGECLLKIRAGNGALDVVAVASVFEDPSGGDDDFGASSPTLLPGGAMVGGGKDGNFYLFDQATADDDGLALRQVFLASYDAKAHQDATATHHIHGAPVVIGSGSDVRVFVWGENDYLRCFRYDQRLRQFPNQPDERNMPGLPLAVGDVAASADSPGFKGMPGGFLSISSDDGKPGTGIVWAAFPPYGDANQNIVRGELRAFAVQESGRRLVSLWSSRCHRDRDDYGLFAKFCPPTVANGRVYLATANAPGAVSVFGRLPTPDGGYRYDVCGNAGLVLNGAAFVSADKIHLTEVGFKAAGFGDFASPAARRRTPHASSCFLRNEVALEDLDTTFVFRVLDYPVREHGAAAPTSDAEGFTFCLQTQGADALGGSGSGFGFGPDIRSRLDRGLRIRSSVAVAFGLSTSSVGVRKDGATPGPQEKAEPVRLSLTSGHRIEARIARTKGTLVVSVVDRDAPGTATFTHVLDVDPVKHLGPRAMMGFTASTGDRSSGFVLDDWRTNGHSSAPKVAAATRRGGRTRSA